MGELIARAERVANALDAHGVPARAAVGVLSENRTEFVEADTAIALAGRVRVALNARLHLDDFRYVAEDADLRVLFYSAAHCESAAILADEFGLVPICLDASADGLTLPGLVESGAPTVRIRPTADEDAAWITYTSGTTGRPKGIVLSHRAVREVAFNLLLELAPVLPGEQILLTQAISHASGYFVLPYLLSGAGVYLMPHFDPDQVWEISRRENIHTLKAVPSMLGPLLDADAGKWGCDTIVYGASSIPQPVLERALDRFGPTLVQDYGQSEAPMTITCLTKLDHLRHDARLSAGRPWRNVALELRGVDGDPVATGELGEIFLQGPHMMTRYHKKPEATAEVLVDGWLRTKDMARMDPFGFVYLQGRNDEMINSGGWNIAPREVEDVLVTYAGVEEVVVLGLPDPKWGDAVTAVIRTSGESVLSVADINAFAKPRLGMRAPKRIEIWTEIPRTAYGKVDRVSVRRRLNGDTSP
jgi:fatty-acyl-CoA synthase